MCKLLITIYVDEFGCFCFGVTLVLCNFFAVIKWVDFDGGIYMYIRFPIVTWMCLTVCDHGFPFVFHRWLWSLSIRTAKVAIMALHMSGKCISMYDNNQCLIDLWVCGMPCNVILLLRFCLFAVLLVVAMGSLRCITKGSKESTM